MYLPRVHLRPAMKVIGWNVNPPKSWTEEERFQYYKISVSPLKALAQINYNRGNKQKSIDYLKQVLVLDPADPDANGSIVQIYQEMGNLDKALEELNQLIKSNPTNKYFWSQYGDIMMNTEKYDEAIEKYTKALELDPTFDLVLRNIASAYKNKASIIQREQSDRMSKDKKYQPETEKYFPFLKKSAEYFERSLKTDRFKNDFQVLGELGNIYTVLEDKSKLNNVIKNLEAIEYQIDDKYKINYYLMLINIYSSNDMSEKLQKVTEKYEALQK